MPASGSDGGHHGVDFGFYRYGKYDRMAGVPIQSVLDGVVAGVLPDRRPYGNAIIIETSVDKLPPDWQSVLAGISPPQAVTLDGHLQCPQIIAPVNANSDHRSLYILYAHMFSATDLSIGTSVHSGEIIGAVGTSGASINEHLHLEIRLGFSGNQFDQMAHYINDASTDEMDQYCTWRVSGWYELLDPMLLLSEDHNPIETPAAP
jgi:murein DD-endopeptidase MepM/ murein hydrolase activator NlpD